MSYLQRKNNLCRRLRIEKQKEEEKKKALETLHGTGSVKVSSGEQVPVEQNPIDDSKPSAIPRNALSPENVGRPRQDSLDEEILDLPGLGALDEDLGFDFNQESTV